MSLSLGGLGKRNPAAAKSKPVKKPKKDLPTSKLYRQLKQRLLEIIDETGRLDAILDNGMAQDSVGEQSFRISPEEENSLYAQKRTLEEEHKQITRKIIEEFQVILQRRMGKRVAGKKPEKNIGHSQTVGKVNLDNIVCISGVEVRNVYEKYLKSPTVLTPIKYLVDKLTSGGVKVTIKSDVNEVSIHDRYSPDDIRTINTFISSFIKYIELIGFCVYTYTKSTSTNMPIPQLCDPVGWNLAYGINPQTLVREYRLLSARSIGTLANVKSNCLMDYYLSMSDEPNSAGKLTTACAAQNRVISICDDLPGIFAKSCLWMVNPSVYVENSSTGFKPLIDPKMADSLGIPTKCAEAALWEGDEFDDTSIPSIYDIDQTQMQRIKEATDRAVEQMNEETLERKTTRPDASHVSSISINSELRARLRTAYEVPAGGSLKSLPSPSPDKIILEGMEIFRQDVAASIAGKRAVSYSNRKYASEAQTGRKEQQEELAAKYSKYGGLLSVVFSNLFQSELSQMTVEQFDQYLAENFGQEFNIDQEARTLDALLFNMEQSCFSCQRNRPQVTAVLANNPVVDPATVAFFYNSKFLSFTEARELSLSYANISHCGSSQVHPEDIPEKLDYIGTRGSASQSSSIGGADGDGRRDRNTERPGTRN